MRLFHIIEDLDAVDTPSFDEVAKKHNVDKAKLQKELDIGINDEMEHTNSKKQSRKIALDHLDELPDYYTRLRKMKKDAVSEDILSLHGDMYEDIDVAATPISNFEVKNLAKLGKGLRIIVSLDPDKKIVLVWAGDSVSHIGAIHATIADQFDIDRYVPLELSASTDNLHVTITATEFFDEPRDVEDALDRNSEFQRLFGSYTIDYSVMSEF